MQQHENPSNAGAPVTVITETGMSRFKYLPLPAKLVVYILFAAGIVFFLIYAWGWSIGDWVLESTLYYYLLYLCFSTCVFLIMPARRKDRQRLPWYDVVLATLIFGILMYFVANTRNIVTYHWVPPPTLPATVMATVIAVIALESGRRLAQIPFIVICVIAGAYPLVSDYLPGALWGPGFNFDFLIGSFAYGMNGMLGLPAQVTGNVIIGFLIFAGTLIVSGAADFFLNISTALMGRFRGGPAKVAVLSSGFFGSLSGTSVSNIIATGSVTIPAMKKLGYPAHYAAAIEACASNGGMIMPPVMGTIAFIMATLTGVPYAEIMVAAALPAILYYFSLLVGVDAYAARVGLKGLPREEIPPLWDTLKDGWIFLVAMIFLVVGLLYFRWGVKAPVYASGLMLVLSLLLDARRNLSGRGDGDTRISLTQALLQSVTTLLRRLRSALLEIGSMVSFIMAVLLPVGLLIWGLTVNGAMTALTAQIVGMAGGNVLVILIIAVLICYVFGMVGMGLIPYIVLAVLAIPALADATGLSLIGLHLFVIYFLITGAITPPVAISAFVAAAVAQAPPMKVAFTSMRLAVVVYFLPFFFVFNSALIFEGPLIETLYLFVFCLIGITILAGGLEGYLLFVGRLPWWARLLLVLGGFGIAFPGWLATGIGAAVTAVAIVLVRQHRKIGLRALNA